MSQRTNIKILTNQVSISFDIRNIGNGLRFQEEEWKLDLWMGYSLTPIR